MALIQVCVYVFMN